MMDLDEGSSFSVDVILTQAEEEAPFCPHGPALLFQKVCRGDDGGGRRFYACSACRDRRDCSFFQWYDEKVSEARLLAREEENHSKRPPFSHSEYCSRFKKFVSLPLEEKKFCQDCQVLLLPGEHGAHSSHKSTTITAAQLKRPSVLLRPFHNKKSHAQYLFAERSVHFLLDTLTRLGYKKVLCVGTPRLQELIKLQNLEENREQIKSLLLDIDFRYAQFYSQDEFCHYNMFNHHFFSGEAGSRVLQTFLKQSEDQRLVMVADPPFGGLVKPLANSFSQISHTWRKVQSPNSAHVEMAMIWIFPYFFESRILECLPSFSMLDYQVDYDNHPLYKHGKTGRKQSPVRIFTNISPRDFLLPKEDGYRFCPVCERYVSAMNKHCAECGICPSKDGREWKHCSLCHKCVKPSWTHCPSCDRCALPAHPCVCTQQNDGCFRCGCSGHKRQACPLGDQSQTSRFQSKGRTRTVSQGPVCKAKRKYGSTGRADKTPAQHSKSPRQTVSV
ncbi:rRNA N6-adenosine-methyltransferase ZCCHC4 [Thalassophryne amazonica]|uniref:rRNA N6-adenosine-methyltransferase ZCCHC4 n=1 Tax=Thalassophryne amazonica TaxID=390379 RepID=UPI001471D6AB|nr:rRNA N6-adenosine-methyltransferase ZCCHC4 [Thalassophryne amazonica]